MHVIVKLLLPVLVVYATGLAGQEDGQAEDLMDAWTKEQAELRAELRAVDVIVQVRDHEGKPLRNVPVTVESRMLGDEPDGRWEHRTEENGRVRVKISVPKDESHIRVGVYEFLDNVYDRWAIPRLRPIDVNDGATIYHHTIVFRPKTMAAVAVTDARGRPLRTLGITSTSVRANNGWDENPGEPLRLEGLARGAPDMLVGSGNTPGNPMSFFVELDASQTSTPLVEVSAVLPTYNQTSALLVFGVSRRGPMIYSRYAGEIAITLISADGNRVYTFGKSYMSGSPAFVLQLPSGHAVPHETIPSVEPGKYFIAPGSPDYEPTLKLIRNIRAGNDVTGSITEITAIEDQAVGRVLDLVQLEADIIELLGL